MKHLAIFLLVFLIGHTVVAQKKFERQLDSINDETQANAFFKQNKNFKGKVFTFNKSKHNTRLAQELFKMGKGGKKVFKTDIDKTYYKILKKTKTPHYRVSYIYLDGSKMSNDEINKLRSKIISQYKSGYRFSDLAKHYSMDGNANREGDLGWFTKGQMHPVFESEVMNNKHRLNDIFTVDIPENNWYYVVLKTHDRMDIEEIQVLKVTKPL